MRVLVVERAVDEAAVLRSAVVEAGHMPLGDPEQQGLVEAIRLLRPDAVLVDVDGPGEVEAIAQLVRADRDARVVAATHRRHRDLAAQTVQAGARDIVFRPFNVVEQVVDALDRALHDDGTFPRFLEQMFAWHELGARLERDRRVSREVVEQARATAQSKGIGGVFQPLLEAGVLDEKALMAVLEDCHKQTTLMLLCLKAKALSSAQLRAAFAIQRRTGESIDKVIVDLGMATNDELAAVLKLHTPPPRGWPPPAASMAMPKPTSPPVDLVAEPRKIARKRPRKPS